MKIDIFSKTALKQVESTFVELSNILGLFESLDQIKPSEENERVDEKLIELLIEIRQKLRAEKHYELSDQIRDQLNNLGIILEDSADGVKWKRK